jgi:hypothetical protein
MEVKLWIQQLYTDVEGCTKLGTLKVDIQDPSEENRHFRVNMIFGNTELKVTAFDEKSGDSLLMGLVCQLLRFLILYNLLHLYIVDTLLLTEIY